MPPKAAKKFSPRRMCGEKNNIEFDSVFGKNNIYGCQFHPEKSHEKGLVFLNNFVNI